MLRSAKPFQSRTLKKTWLQFTRSHKSQQTTGAKKNSTPDKYIDYFADAGKSFRRSVRGVWSSISSYLQANRTKYSMRREKIRTFSPMTNIPNPGWKGPLSRPKKVHCPSRKTTTPSRKATTSQPKRSPLRPKGSLV